LRKCENILDTPEEEIDVTDEFDWEKEIESWEPKEKETQKAGGVTNNRLFLGLFR